MCACVYLRGRMAWLMCFCKGFKVVWLLEECNWKKKTVSSIQWCLHLGRVFFFHLQIQYLRQSTHNGKLLELQKCRRTKSELISVKTETWAHGKSLEKNPGKRQSHRRVSDIFPNSRWARVGQVRKWYGEVQPLTWSIVSPAPIELGYLLAEGPADLPHICPMARLCEPREG